MQIDVTTDMFFALPDAAAVEVQKMLLTEEQHAHQQRSSNTHIPSR
jgi:hypothetical protein